MMSFSFPYNHWWCGPGMFFPGPFGLIVTFIFWGLILFLVVKLFQILFRTRSGNSDSDSQALNILKNRYARGEISKEDFDRMRKEIR